MKRNTSNWSNFGMLLRRAGLTLSSGLSCLNFCQPMHFNAQCHFLLDQFCLFFRLSVTSRSTAKIVGNRPVFTAGSLQEVTTGILRGPISNPIPPPLLPKLLAHNPQSKLASQIAAKQCQIEQCFVLTAYRNIPSPYPKYTSTLQSRGTPSPKGRSSNNAEHRLLCRVSLRSCC